MPQNERGPRPGRVEDRSTPKREDTPDYATGREPTPNTSQMLHRRRAASYRLPPLRCGRRDPLDSTAPLNKRELQAWEQAIRLLAQLGYVAVIPHDVASALRGRCS